MFYHEFFNYKIRVHKFSNVKSLEMFLIYPQDIQLCNIPMIYTVCFP